MKSFRFSCIGEVPTAVPTSVEIMKRPPRTATLAAAVVVSTERDRGNTKLVSSGPYVMAERRSGREHCGFVGGLI
jgi:hypothetical protein